MRRIPLHHFDVDMSLYPRNQPSWITIARYSDAMRQGKNFPPVLAGRRNGRYVLIDGLHRYFAARSAKIGLLATELCRLPEKDWYLEAVRRNATHGQPLSPQEARRAIVRLQEEGYPVTTIADAVGVPVSRWETFVGDRVTSIADRERVVLKSIIDAPRASKLTSEELAELEKKQCVRDAALLVDQLLCLIEADNIDANNPELRGKLERLQEGLTRLLKR